MFVYLAYTVKLNLRPFLLPDSAFGNTWHRQCDIQGQLALPSEDTHHAEGLHLTAGGIDWGTAQICQLAEHNTVLIWDGTARTAIRWWFISWKRKINWERKCKESQRTSLLSVFIRITFPIIKRHVSQWSWQILDYKDKRGNEGSEKTSEIILWRLNVSVKLKIRTFVWALAGLEKSHHNPPRYDLSFSSLSWAVWTGSTISSLGGGELRGSEPGSTGDVVPGGRLWSLPAMVSIPASDSSPVSATEGSMRTSSNSLRSCCSLPFPTIWYKHKHVENAQRNRH